MFYLFSLFWLWTCLSIAHYHDLSGCLVTIWSSNLTSCWMIKSILVVSDWSFCDLKHFQKTCNESCDAGYVCLTVLSSFTCCREGVIKNLWGQVHKSQRSYLIKFLASSCWRSTSPVASSLEVWHCKTSIALCTLKSFQTAWDSMELYGALSSKDTKGGAYQLLSCLLWSKSKSFATSSQ